MRPMRVETMRRSGRMGRSSCSSEEGLKRGTWLAEEDEILARYVSAHGEGKWKSLPKRAGLKRCGKSCRLRWLNYLRPNIKRGNISEQEEDLIIRLHRLLGNRWSLIAGRLPGRTDNEIKNYWNTTLWRKIEGQPLRAPKRSQSFFETSIERQNHSQEAKNYVHPPTPRTPNEKTAQVGLQELGDVDVAGTEIGNSPCDWMVGGNYDNALFERTNLALWLDDEERDNHIAGDFQSVTSFLDSEWM